MLGKTECFVDKFFDLARSLGADPPMSVF